jgi:hypothetical protein
MERANSCPSFILQSGKRASQSTIQDGAGQRCAPLEAEQRTARNSTKAARFRTDSIARGAGGQHRRRWHLNAVDPRARKTEHLRDLSISSRKAEGRLRDRVQGGDLSGRQRHVQRGEVGRKLIHPSRADQGRGYARAATDPGQGDGSGGCADFGGNRQQGVDHEIIRFGPLADPGATTPGASIRAEGQ